jgi:hypothetical protein
VAIFRKILSFVLCPRHFPFLVLIVIASVTATCPSHAFSPNIGKAVGTLLLRSSVAFGQALPETKIVQLARVAEKPGGTKIVGDELSRLNLPSEVLEDTFARILVFQGHVPESEALGWMHRLTGVDGFRAAMRKSMGASPANTIGHLNEVRIADNAALGNFKVRGIGVPFKDPNKKGLTDIDVLLEKRGQQIAIEAKDYSSNATFPLDTFRADMLTLDQYRSANPQKQVLPVFSITNKPNNPDVWRLLQAAAEQHKVELLVGSPEDLMFQIPLLLK